MVIKNRFCLRWVVALIVALTSLFPSAMSQISPFDFGLRDAHTGTQRYWALYNAHVEARARGLEVSYAGIDTLNIVLPPDYQSIPLGPHTDFGGLVLYVTNNERDGALFAMHAPTKAVSVPKAMVDGGDFREIPELSSGDKLLILRDQKPWTERIGYGYRVYRQDVLLLHDGVGENTPIAPWNTDSTDLNASVVAVDSMQKVFRGLTMHRVEGSEHKTYCLHVSGQCNLLIEDVHVTTPKSKMIADAVFGISNSVRVTFRDVTVDGTYSGYGRWRDWGYAFSLSNLWDTKFERVTADGNWGVFGTNNLSHTTLEDCDLNRFDIHCYGRDVYIYNCMFTKLYNQFSSVYGTLLFEGCHFSNFIPVLTETSYNAYTPFDLTFRNCTFDAYQLRNYLISIGKVDKERNSRPELAQKCWPNVNIENMTVNVKEPLSKVILFYPKGEASTYVDHISNVKINGMKFNYKDTVTLTNFVIANTPVTSKKTINYDIKNMTLIPSVERMKRQAEKKFSYPASLVINLRKDKNNRVNVSKSRLNYNVNENSQYNITFTSCEIGMIRYNSNSNGTKRQYVSCKLYLNNNDDLSYYIDNQATYNSCIFIPCDDKMFINFYGSKNNVVFKNCKTTRKGRLFFLGKKDNSELKNHSVKGAAKIWK